MTTNKNNRRKLLKGIVAGGGVAGAGAVSQWTAPVIESVVLPSHAATSVIAGAGPSFSGNLQNPLVFQDHDGEGLLVARSSPTNNKRSLLDFLIPSAHASPQTAEATLIGKAGNKYNFFLLITIPSDIEECSFLILLTVKGLKLGSSKESTILDCLGDGGPGPTIELVDVTDTEAFVSVGGSSPESLMLDPAAMPLALVDCTDCVD